MTKSQKLACVASLILTAPYLHSSNQEELDKLQIQRTQTLEIILTPPEKPGNRRASIVLFEGSLTAENSLKNQFGRAKEVASAKRRLRHEMEEWDYFEDGVETYV